MACVRSVWCDRSIEWYRSLCAMCERLRTLEDIGKNVFYRRTKCLKFSENSKPSKCFGYWGEFFYFLNCQNILNSVSVQNRSPLSENSKNRIQ